MQNSAMNSSNTVAVRLVGWGYGIKETPEKNKQVVQSIKNYCITYSISLGMDFEQINWILMFDGDLCSPEGFTQFICAIVPVFPHSCKVVAVKKNSSVHKLYSDYSEVDHGVTVTGYIFYTNAWINGINNTDKLKVDTRFFIVSVPKEEIKHWSQLGIKALEWAWDVQGIHSALVFCIGGGREVKNEKEAVEQADSNIKHTKYLALAGLSRYNAKGEEETCFDYPKSDTITVVEM